jgi:signal transduction histidine kinase
MKELLERFHEQLNEASITVDAAIQPEVFGVWDRSRIEQIMVNLLSNAVKYAPGSTVRIELRGEGDWAEFSVSDTGPGIPLERQARVFERFERAVSSRNISGLGLGLFIARQIVEAHGGTIALASQPERGTKFTVKLPATANLPD